MYDVNKLLEIALSEEGYKEKKSNASLDSPTANAGTKNYTKYSRDLVNMIGGPYAQGVAWCDNFNDWCFIKAFGKDAAKKLLGGWSAYTPTSALYYKNMGRYYRTNPKVGDQIFFKKSNGMICHTGIVYKVSKSYVYTIEGNKNDGVTKCKYSLNNGTIDGYGRPNYGKQPEAPKKQGYTGSFPAVSPLLRNGRMGPEVKKLQMFLNWFGGYSLVVDGIFGKYTETAVKDFQKKVGIAIDGIFGPISLTAAMNVVK